MKSDYPPDVDEVARLLDSVENGFGLTDTQKRYHKYTRQRDLAILTLFLEPVFESVSA